MGLPLGSTLPRDAYTLIFLGMGTPNIYRIRLPGRGEMLANPRLLEPERVKPYQIVQVPALAIPDGPLRRVGRHQ